MKTAGDRVRIKRGVRPYGGRVLTVIERKVYANGRRVVIVQSPLWNKGLRDPRVYEDDEVEEVRHEAR